MPNLRLAVFAFVASLALATAPVQATICAPDSVPAATLLVPYFEVDLDACHLTPPERLDTEVAVGNASGTPRLAGVTIWSDFGVPVTGFIVYLPGESTQRLTLGEFLCTGVAPQTGPAVSPHPPGTDPPSPFPGCNNSSTPGFAPNYANPAAPAYFLAHVQEALTGQLSSLYGLFFGQDWGDHRARGFLTVDVLNECHVAFPTTPGYFLEGLGLAAAANVLVGEWSIRDNPNNFAFAEPAVALESGSSDFAPGDLTFYGSHLAVDGSDEREPLPTTFASTFAPVSGFTAVEQIVWRERADYVPSSIPGYPLDLPLAKQNVTWFDDATTPFPSFIFGPLPGDPGIDLVQYPVVSHSYPPSDVPFPVPFGWQYSRLQNSQSSYPAGQSWWVTRTQSLGRFETSSAAIPLDSSCVNLAFVPRSDTFAATGGYDQAPTWTLIFWADFEDYFGGWSKVDSGF